MGSLVNSLLSYSGPGCDQILYTILGLQNLICLHRLNNTRIFSNLKDLNVFLTIYVINNLLIFNTK